MHITHVAGLTKARRIIAAAAMTAILGGLLLLSPVPSAHASAGAANRHPRPTIVLEHGAWADASSWNGVIPILQHEGYTVYAPPNPLRSLTGDAAYLAAFLKTISGPIILVGHSYGGAVITNAATGNPNVKALVYIDGFIPAKGDTIFGLTFAKPGSCLNAATSFNVVPLADGIKGDVDTYLKVGSDKTYPGFDKCFANGVPARQAAELAAGQRPLALSAGSEKSGVPAWRSIPSWALVGTADHVIPPAELVLMAKDAHAHIQYVDAGHLSMVSHPTRAASVINDAVHATE
jgi:pimeloyl-ACP methyl ester carboxylesterase